MTHSQTLQIALRAAIAEGAHRVGPFLVTVDPDATGPFRNFAVPDDGAAASPDELAALFAFFTGHDRLPRLEFVAPAPLLEQALVEAGATVAARLRLLVLPSVEALVPAPVLPGVLLTEPGTDATLRAVAAMQNNAFGEPGISDADVARLRRCLDAGGAVVAAIDAANGEVLSAGQLGTPRGGFAELTGLATAQAHRHRGLAAAVATRLSAAASARCVVAFLQAAGPAEQRMYERLGYEPVGELIDARGPLPAGRGTAQPAPSAVTGRAP